MSGARIDTDSLDLYAIEERAERAATEVARLCDISTGGPGNNWRWSIPADPKRDSDLILAASLVDVPALVAEVRRLRALVEPQPAARAEPPHTWRIRSIGTSGSVRELVNPNPRTGLPYTREEAGQVAASFGWVVVEADR